MTSLRWTNARHIAIALICAPLAGACTTDDIPSGQDPDAAFVDAGAGDETMVEAAGPADSNGDDGGPDDATIPSDARNEADGPDAVVNLCLPPIDGGTCLPGPCVPANPCEVGALSCAGDGGVPTCVSTGARLPVGSSCAAGAVCGASGDCAIAACVSVPANLPNCVADHPCHIGHCDALNPTCSDLTVLGLLGNAPDGIACGPTQDTLRGVCQSGSCVVPGCTDGGPACDFACTSATGAALPAGARCGANGVCLGGACQTEMTITGAPFAVHAGVAICDVVATFSEADVTEPASSFTASVDWGDGSSAPGTVSGGAGAFAVHAAHVYAVGGTFTVTVLVTDVVTGAKVTTTYGVSDHIVEYSLPSAVHPGPIVEGPDGNLWFGQDGSVGRISKLGTGYTSIAVNAPRGVGGIAVGPDGNLWVRGGGVDRVTPAGVVTHFTLPSPEADPQNITAGPDGNLWFAENGDTISRITPAGVVTEFPLTGTGHRVWSMCAGPDGSVWFTEYIGNSIGRVTPAGVITEYALPTAEAYPAGITAGPDGNLWFVEVGLSQVGRITPSGVLMELPTGGGPTADLHAIISGPGGSLWFTEYNTDRIGRMTTSGVVTQFKVPTSNALTWELTAASDGNVWFTESFKSKIGRVEP